MSRGRADGSSKKRLVTSVLILVIICGGLYMYSKRNGSTALEYGSKIRKFGSTYLGGDEEVDETPLKLGEDEDDGIILKSIPVSHPV